MAVDEFGREIPSVFTTGLAPAGGAGAVGGGGYNNNHSGSRRRSPSPPHHHHGGSVGGGGGGGPPPRHSYHKSIPQHNYHHQQQDRHVQHPSHYTNIGGGGSGGSQPFRRHQHQQHHHHPKQQHYLSAPVNSLLPTKSTANDDIESTTGSTGNNSNVPARYKLHPSLAYVDEPMLCEFVWKDSQRKATQTQPTAEEGGPATKKVKLEDGSAQPIKSEPDDDNDEDKIDREEGKEDTIDNTAAAEENTTDDPDLSKSYEEYRKRYCLNYIRAFFNKHLDDSWFRQRFSPSCIKQVTEQEQARAVLEAHEFQVAISKSSSSREQFLNAVRLGGGVKQQQQQQQPLTPSSLQQHPSSSISPRKIPPHDEQQVLTNAPPIQHLFSFQQKQSTQSTTSNDSSGAPSSSSTSTTATTKTLSALHVIDIPSFVTDEQIGLALVDQYNTAVMARHEEQLAEAKNATTTGGGAGADSSDQPTSSSSSPKKGSTSSSTKSNNIPAPTLLRSAEIKVYPAPGTLISDGPPSVVMHRHVLAIGPSSAISEILISLKQRQDKKNKATTTAAAAAVTTAESASTIEEGGGGGSSSVKRVVPRKVYGGTGDSSNDINVHPELFYGPFDLDVECSDPYGRADIDADGRGGAPTDGLTVPPRKAIVGICMAYTVLVSSNTTNAGSSQNTTTANLATTNIRNLSKHHQQQQQHYQHPFATSTVVLSAAVSSKSRFEQDLQSARKIAKALDTKKNIPKGSRLEDIIQSNLLGDDIDPPILSEDILDVSIAYLRRIHLLSFYNGCAAAETIGDVLAGKHPSSTIHLRLQNADDYIQPDDNIIDTTAAAVEGSDKDQEEGTEKEQTIMKKVPAETKKDMLVQRLDDSIAKALDYYEKWLGGDESEDDDHIVPGLIDEQTEIDAKEIAASEEIVKDKWIDDHCIIDADGRARCSFRFCHKLFKDASFLEKHLLKKHVEFLRAEQAKCHDEYMMAAWDACLHRPVPPILVDCGSHFGCVSASIITGQTEPDVTDPEPELWQREEERRIRETEMKKQREELRQQQYNSNNNASDNSSNRYQHQKDRREHPTTDDQQQQQGERQRPRPSSFFVDVDDMKEEKVELTFDAVEVEADSATGILANNKKKKKKRKLL